MIKHIAKGIALSVGGFLAGVAVFFAIELLWWQFFPYQTAEIVEPIRVVSEQTEEINGQQVKVVNRGNQLMLEFAFTKKTLVSPEVNRNVYCEDGSAHFVAIEPRSAASRPVGTFIARSSYGLTEDTPSETVCLFQFTNIYQVNPIRTITKEWRSEPFTIREVE